MNRTLQFLLISFFILSSGCASLQGLNSKASVPGNVQDMEQQPVGPSYLDFSDILIPAELSGVSSESYITNGFGRIVIRGRVDGISVEKFFMTGMPSTGWAFMDEYRYMGNIKMFFSKPDKIASILISENPMDTKVEIWVTPLRKN